MKTRHTNFRVSIFKLLLLFLFFGFAGSEIYSQTTKKIVISCGTRALTGLAQDLVIESDGSVTYRDYDMGTGNKQTITPASNMTSSQLQEIYNITTTPGTDGKDFFDLDAEYQADPPQSGGTAVGIEIYTTDNKENQVFAVNVAVEKINEIVNKLNDFFTENGYEFQLSYLYMEN